MNYVLNVCIYCLSRICHTYNKNMLLTDSASNQATIASNLATTSPQEKGGGGGRYLENCSILAPLGSVQYAQICFIVGAGSKSVSKTAYKFDSCLPKIDFEVLTLSLYHPVSCQKNWSRFNWVEGKNSII